MLSSCGIAKSVLQVVGLHEPPKNTSYLLIPPKKKVKLIEIICEL